jgi:hypothetical protein
MTTKASFTWGTTAGFHLFDQQNHTRAEEMLRRQDKENKAYLVDHQGWLFGGSPKGTSASGP